MFWVFFLTGRLMRVVKIKKKKNKKEKKRKKTVPLHWAKTER